MEIFENNNGAEGINNESSYNEAVKTFIEPNDAHVVPRVVPPPPLLGSYYASPSLTSLEVRPKTHTEPLSEQLGFADGFARDMHLVPQQATASSSNSSEIERHSLNNTGSSNSYGGMVRRRLYSL